MIDKFMNPESGTETKTVLMMRNGELKEVKRKPRTKGMSQVLDSVEDIYDEIDSDIRTEWEAEGLFGNRTTELGRESIVELFTWMMHGRVEYVKGDRLAKKNQAGELIYKKGEGWYINQWWSPTSKSFKNGDVIFGWQNPVPLKYDPTIHEKEKRKHAKKK